jgi:Transglycosylase SLT domain
MSGVKIVISADLQTGDVQAAVQKLVEQLNKTGQAVAAANKVKFEPVTKATIEDLKRVEIGFESLRKVSGELNRRMKATGQQGAGFFDVDWAKLHPDAAVRARQQRRAFEYVTGLGFGDLPAPAAPPSRPQAPSPQHRPPTPPRQPPAPPGVGTLAAGVLRQGLGGGLRAMGAAGGAIEGGISAGMSGGMGVGLAAMGGQLLALGIGKAVGAIAQKVGQAEQESIGYDALKRQLGDVGVGFEGLRQSLRTASNQIGVTFEESQRLAGEFAGLSGLSRNALALAREVSVAGGFGRSFGIAPELAVSAFGQMRGVGLTSTTDDSRRFALMIGEAVARSGVFSKADEILQAVTGYGLSQTRASLTAANLPGYAGMLAGMTSSGIPGMDVAGASNILARMNSAIAGGGAAGDAGQQFLYAALGRHLGLDPIQTRVLEEGGIFGTGSQAFGTGSIYRRFAGRYGLARPGAANSSTTNLELIRRSVEQQYGSNPELMADAFANLTGLNISQSMAMLGMQPAQMGGLQKALQSAHVDISKISPTAFSALANIETGSRSRLMKQVASLRARTGSQALTGAEGAELDAAATPGSDTEQLRDVLLRLSASRDQEKTEGEKTRDSILNLDKTVQTAASALISPINTMRDALVHMAGGSTRSLREAFLTGERKDVSDQADDQIKAARQAYDQKRRAQIAKDRAAHPANQFLPPDQQPYLNTPEQKQLQADFEAQKAKIIADRDAQIARLNAGSGNQIDFGKPPGSDDSGSPDDPGSDDDDAGAGSARPSLGPSGRGAYASMKAGLDALDREFFPNNPGTAAHWVDVESGFDANARSRKGATGYFQFMPDTLADAEREAGRYFDPKDPQQSMQAAGIAMRQKRRYLRAKLGREPTREELLQSWDAGQGRVAEHARTGAPLPGETQAYVPKIDADSVGGTMPLPASASAAGGAGSTQHRIDFGGTFNLQWPNGTPAAAPITTQARVGLPVPSGAG